jgi:uncharacterized protein YggE
MRNKILVIVSVLLIGAVISACSGVAAAQGVTPTASAQDEEPGAVRTITVSGSGQAFLNPDLAHVYIGVRTEGEDAAEAVASNNEQSEDLIAALREFGIAANDIQTSNFSIYPQPRYDDRGQPTGVVSYIVENTVYVTIRDLARVGELLDTAVASGANSINGIQFDVADKTAALSDAREAAVANARQIAEELAAAAGVSLGEIQNISAVSTGFPTPVFMDSARLAAEAAAVPISPGQLSVTVDIQVTFAIR